MTRTKTPPPGSFDYLLDPTYRAPEPPPPGEPPGEPPRRQVVQIDILITDKQRAIVAPAKPARPVPNIWAVRIVLLLLIIAALSLARCAHAQPSQWSSYQQGFTTMHQGTDAQGRTWTGQSYQQGFTTYSDWDGPDGRAQHCTSYRQGFMVRTECNN